MTVGALQANCYLITDPDARQTLIVDPGAEPEIISERLRALGTQVSAIVHTHGHFDHISATEALLVSLPQPVPVAAHPEDAYLYEPHARAVGALMGYLMPDTPLTPDSELRDGEIVTVGSLRLRAVHTPGHTPGGICLVVDGSFVLSGDTLFRRGIGRTDLPGGDEDAIYESILTRLYTLPPELLVYPGHGPSTTIAEERKENPFVQVESR